MPCIYLPVMHHHSQQFIQKIHRGPQMLRLRTGGALGGWRLLLCAGSVGSHIQLYWEADLCIDFGRSRGRVFKALAPSISTAQWSQRAEECGCQPSVEYTKQEATA